MNNIIKTDSIDNLNIELKLHILELNIAFAKREASYPKYPETYDNIVEEIKPFDHTKAIEFLKMFGYDETFYDDNVKGEIDLPIQPAKLQAMIMDDRSRKLYSK